MSVAAIMLVKDEADIVEHTLRYLKSQVDWIYVSDNASTDGTREILDTLENGTSEAWLTVLDDPTVGYYQAEKMTALALRAMLNGYQWVVPVDADEFWYATDGRTIREFLGGLAPDVAYVNADLYNHLPTSLDPQPVFSADGLIETEPNPFKRIGWRQREHGALPKVAACTRPGLEIRQGNHSAYAPGSGVTVPGLCVRHFSWRTAAQYERKIANGARAYAATDLAEHVGAHWRMFGDPDEPTFSDRVRSHFSQWFWVDDPYADASLIYDPAPGA